MGKIDLIRNIAWLILGFALGPGSAFAQSTITARWLGVTGLSITDGEATLLFDPVFTKPGLQHWFLGARFISDIDRVRSGLAAAAVKNAEAIFISHTHFDHTIDAAAIAHLTGAKVYGGPSLHRVIQKSELSVKFELSGDRHVVQVGKFKVTMIRREHPPVLRRLEWKFLEGDVPEHFDFGFYQFHEGEVWCYFVEHRAGNILIDQSSQFFEGNSAYRGRVHTYFIGVANKRSIEDLIWGNIDRIRPRRVVPLHFDAFFLQASWLEKLRYLGPTLDELKKRLDRETNLRVEFRVPILFDPIQSGAN